MADVIINVVVTAGPTINANMSGVTTIQATVVSGGVLESSITGGGRGPIGPEGPTSTTPGPPGPGVAEGGTTGQVLRKASNDDFDDEWHTPVKADVGLGNAENTTDLAKPISTATQSALDAKQALDADLTAIAALNSATSGVIASEGAGWVQRTFAQLKALLVLVKGDVGLGNVDNTSDVNKPVSTAQQTALDLKLDDSQLDTDGTLAANSDAKIPSQKAVKTYADQIIASADAMVFKGVIDCSANPNYPAADKGWTYRVSVAGKIGGASGVVVEIGDILLCLVDGSASGNQATVGANWSVAQTNIDGSVIGPASVTDDLPAIFDGTTGKLIKSKTYAAFKTLLALVKGDVGLGNVDNVQQQPIDADLTTIAGLSPSNNDLMIYNAGAWANRTPAQARTHLGLGVVALLATVTEADITLVDNTTNDFSTTKHGFVPKGTNTGKFLKDNGTWDSIPGGGDALTSNPLSQFAPTTSAQLRGVLSDETGSGAAVFGTSPTLTTPTINSPSGINSADVGLGNVDNTSDATKNAASVSLTNKTIDGDLNTLQDIGAASLKVGGLRQVEFVYTANDTWTKPAGLRYVIVEVQAGGGAGGSAGATGAGECSYGGGGGSGGYARKKILAASLGSTETVTVGAGGTAVASNDGNPGGTSSFGTHAVTSGGGGGIFRTANSGTTSNSPANGGDPGAASAGDLQVAGQAGTFGMRYTTAARGVGGVGGHAVMGGGGKGFVNTSTSSGGVGAVGGNYGGGGGGAHNSASQSARLGGAGGVGLIIVTEFY